ncbi:tRNA (adenosine(37)-N6)-threonylcarbamoyltransferase complex transferase subunit TsaD [Candidatus Woesearchaeota archaeon]|nr:tRNA (adenosine(37)-N6)-threonylcarbamoyltransferase complex transferase subunit TsaD [Candidatus Woesearchaeota archaeon]
MSHPQLILGVETTAHTFGIGIITSNGKILANIKDSYTSPDKGMIPDEIANHHKAVAQTILEKAFKTAGCNWEDISFISYSAGPGLDPALWAGYHKAKEWATQHKKKLVAVNHCCAHLSIGALTSNAKDPCYLYVSGVNTQIIVQINGKYRVMGETLDIGLGNMLDKFGRITNLGFPAGPKVEQLAKSGKYVELPYTIKGMDISFSGPLTRAEQLFKKGEKVEDLCFSLQETCFAMCTEVVERAMAHTEKNELILVGGVGANKRFCEMLEIMCKERGATFYNVPMDLAGDQGVMIAWEGWLRKDESGDVEIKPHWRADEV